MGSMCLEYNKCYYEKNKDKLLEKMNKKEYCIICDCYFSFVNKMRHYKTKKHINKLFQN